MIDNSQKYIFLTRNYKYSLEYKKILKTLQVDSIIHPLYSIKNTDHKVLHNDLARYQAIILTSRHAVQALRQILELKSAQNLKFIFCVGEAIERELVGGTLPIYDEYENAFSMVRDLQSRLSPDNGPCLYLRGQDISFNLKDKLAESSIEVDEHIVYQLVTKTEIRPAVRLLFDRDQISAIPFFSVRTARHVLNVMHHSDLNDQLKNIDALCLSTDIAKALPHRLFRKVHIADQPNRQSMINLIQSVCTSKTVVSVQPLNDE